MSESAPSRAVREPTSTPHASAAEKPALRATVGEPAVLDFTRAAIRPQAIVLAEATPAELPPVVMPEPIPEPPPLTLEELEAALAEAEKDEPGAAASREEPETRLDPASATDGGAETVHFGIALTEEQVVFDRARTCVEDLSGLCAMRRPRPEQGWTGRASTEQRLLSRVDAIAACGAPVLPRLVTLLEERPVPDPGFAWALVFLFGSLSGEDAAEQAMRIARIVPLEADGVMDAVSDALALAPHPALVPPLQKWLNEPSPYRRAAAVAALARRGALASQQAVAAAMDPDPAVALAGATALRASSGAVDGAAWRDLARRSEETLVRAALESAIIRRSPVAVGRALQLVEEGRPDFAGAALIVAVASGPESLELLRKAAAAKSVTAIDALGWYGHPAAVEDLLQLLQGDTAKAAVEALQLLTGASLTDADPAPQYEKGKEPFTAAEGPVPEEAIFTTKPDVWSAWWDKHGKAARPGTRYRFGHVWSLADDLRQIESRLATRAQRWPAYLELCARSGANLPFDPDAFVVRQRRQIADWSAHLAQRRGTGWPVHLERS